MAADVLIHLVLEALGALSLRCALGLCDHTWHRVAVWLVASLVLSIVTVHFVG